MIVIKPIEVAHQMLKEVIERKDIVVDATMGNGYDTLFLSQLSDHVYAFDIQKEALKATEEKLALAHQKATLILDGHEHLLRYIEEPIKAAIFNLGYLPNTDKSIITRPETTLAALSVLTARLCVGGRIALMIYYGHKGGRDEKNALVKWAQNLPQEYWHSFSYVPLNQIHTPPLLIILEKRK